MDGTVLTFALCEYVFIVLECGVMIRLSYGFIGSKVNFLPVFVTLSARRVESANNASARFFSVIFSIY